jgi:tetratricopeptide (TPR) repeat protein
LDSALAALDRSDFEAAERLADDAASMVPVDVLWFKGLIRMRKNQADAAVPFFRMALQMKPDHDLSLEWLLSALMKSGRYAEAIDVAERTLALKPNAIHLMHALSQAQMRLGEVPKAIRTLESATAISPRDPGTRHLLGQAYERAKRNRDALSEYREAIRLKPEFADAYDRSNRILLEEGRFSAAFKLCEQAFSALPLYGQARLQAAQALWMLGRIEEAEAAARKAVELDPELAEPVAAWYQAYGRTKEALSLLEESLAERPFQGRAYYGIAKLREVGAEERSCMETLVADRGLPPKERYALLRALAKDADDAHDYGTAMQRFDESAEFGRRLFGAEHVFDSKRLDAARESLLRFLDSRYLIKCGELGRRDVSPIFVIGMIRSGTTLVQQILTSHPAVGDAGEQPFWTTEYPALVDLNAGEVRREAFLDARDRYLEVLKRFDGKAPRISNKWPMNYAHAGLLVLAYPDAKIVHVARNPIDTALSIYMTDLGVPPPEFVHEKRNIVSVYRDYQKRMRHWESSLPKHSLFTLQYEDLVAEQETWTRKLLEFCSLDWDPRCLTFYEGERRVHTPSMAQVRKPIYATSTEKWRRYEPWLGELAELLNG